MQEWTGGAVFVFGFHNGSAEAFALPHSTRLELARKCSWPEKQPRAISSRRLLPEALRASRFHFPELRSESVVSRMTVLRLKVSMCRWKDSTFFFRWAAASGVARSNRISCDSLERITARTQTKRGRSRAIASHGTLQTNADSEDSLS